MTISVLLHMQLVRAVVLEAVGLRVRCGKETQLFLLYPFMLFKVFFFFLMDVFHFWNKLLFFESVSPEANLERRPADTCQFPQFFPGSHPFTVCSASGNVLEYRMRVRGVYRHGSVSSGNFICDADGYIWWLIVYTTP